MAVRIVSAAVGIVIAAVVLFFHNTIVLNIALGLITTGMVYEVLKAGKCENMPIAFIPSLLYAFLLPFWAATKFSFLITFLYVICIFGGMLLKHKTVSLEKIFFILAVSVLITNAMSTLIIIHKSDPTNGLIYLIMGLCGAWLADSGAYFVGTFMGKNKLCPEISPKKTIEGLIGGILITGFLFILISFIYTKIMEGYYDTKVRANYFSVFILGMLMAVIGTLGDLSASVVKRKFGIKDYGNIMPGHGGFMDRFDSVVFTAPFMFVFTTVIDIFY